MSGEVVAGLHHTREDARHFLPALAELGDDDADALLAFLEPRPRPLRGDFQLVLCGWKGCARGRAHNGVRSTLDALEAREEFGSLRRHDVEGVRHYQAGELELREVP